MKKSKVILDKQDNINHPSHYTSGKIEVIDAIEDWNLGFHRGNVIKYVARAGKKDPLKELEDLEKAQWYLNREIEKTKSRMPKVLASGDWEFERIEK